MLAESNDGQAIDRRRFVQTLLLPASIAGCRRADRLNGGCGTGGGGGAGPDIIDCNVHLFEWPFRKLKYARTEALDCQVAQAPHHEGVGPAASRPCSTSNSTPQA